MSEKGIGGKELDIKEVIGLVWALFMEKGYFMFRDFKFYGYL